MYDNIKKAFSFQDLSGEAQNGLYCDACDLGPCVFSDDSPDKIAPCGITPDKMAIKNLAEKVIEGMAEYRQTIQQLSKLYKIEKLMAIASESLSISLSYTRKIERLLSPHRVPRTVAFGLGGIEESMINICAAAPVDKIYELMMELRREEYSEMARRAGADGINVVSMGAPGAEMAYQMGIPCIGNFMIAGDARATGGLDAMFLPWSDFSVIEKGAGAFKERVGDKISVPEKEYFPTGQTPDGEKLNEAYSKGDIAGAVFMFGAASITCTWDMDKLVSALVEKGYVVLVSGARLYRETGFPEHGPRAIHLGFCEPGKIMQIGLNFRPVVLAPGWKNPKLLTSLLGMAHVGYNVILGNELQTTASVRNALESKNLIIESDWEKVVATIEDY